MVFALFKSSKFLKSYFIVTKVTYLKSFLFQKSYENCLDRVSNDIAIVEIYSESQFITKMRQSPTISFAGKVSNIGEINKVLVGNLMIIRRHNHTKNQAGKLQGNF